jgi:hypothetical protein
MPRFRRDGLADQAKPLLLHDGAGDGIGFPGADRVGDVGRTGRDDAPDHPLLVVVEADYAAGAGQGQTASVEPARHQVGGVGSPRTVRIMPHRATARRPLPEPDWRLSSHPARHSRIGFPSQSHGVAVAFDTEIPSAAAARTGSL